jgi:hypothetical protein
LIVLRIKQGLDPVECIGLHDLIFTPVHGENGGMVEWWLPIWMGVAAATDHTSERKAAAAVESHRSTLGKAKQNGPFKGDSIV